MLGGLIKENNTKTETKVPILGDIPFFGQIFKGQTNNKQRNELIIFIRPSVLRNDREAVAEARRRAAMLKAGEELGLEQQFAPSESHTNKPAANKTSSSTVSTNQRAAAQSPVAPADKDSSPDLQSAKVRGLKMQDGDSMTR